MLREGYGIHWVTYIHKGVVLTVLSVLSNLQGKVNATVANVNAMKAMRAQPVSAWCLKKAVVPQTTPSALAEGLASVTAVNVRRDTSVHNARHALAALIHARPNCKESKVPFNFYFLIIIIYY